MVKRNVERNVQFHQNNLFKKVTCTRNLMDLEIKTILHLMQRKPLSTGEQYTLSEGSMKGMLNGSRK